MRTKKTGKIMPADWRDVNVDGDPRFVLGWRGGTKKIKAQRVDVGEDLFDELRSIARSALDAIEEREAKPYAPFGAITKDDYFDIDVTDLPRKRDRRKREDDPAAYSLSSAITMITATDEHAVMTAEELRECKPPDLYAIVFKSKHEYVGFVRNVSPQKPLKPGWKFLRYGDTLRKLEPPDLAIDDAIDMVITEQRCAVLSSGAFDKLFGDVKVAFQHVPENAKTVADALKGTLPLSPGSLDRLRERCGRRLTDARRLDHIVRERQDALEAMTRSQITGLLAKRGLAHTVNEGALDLQEDEVSEFLDVVEGRLFTDDLTQEEKRADAYSPRPGST